VEKIKIMYKIFQKDNFSDSKINYKANHDNQAVFYDILGKYYESYQIKEVSQLDRKEINSENYKIILKLGGKIKKILLRKHKFLKNTKQVDFYLNLLNDLASKNVKVIRIVRSKKGKLSIVLDENIYSVFEFVESTHFTASIKAFQNLAQAIAQMHLGFDSLNDFYLSKIKAQNKRSGVYYNVIKKYSESDFIKIADAISGKKNKTEIDKFIMQKLPLILSAVREVEKQKKYISGAKNQIIHSDLHPHNILMRHDKVDAILDFDSIRIHNHGKDIASAIYRFGRQFFIGQPKLARNEAPKLREIFIKKYEGIKKLTNDQIRALPLLLKDEFLIKLLYVLNAVYLDKNELWAGDLPKFLAAFDEIDYFWPDKN